MKLKLYNKGPLFIWSPRALGQVIFSPWKKITNRVTEIFFLLASNSSCILINLKLVYVSLILHEIYVFFLSSIYVMTRQNLIDLWSDF